VVDPQRATTAFLDLARKSGTDVSFRSPVTAIEGDSGVDGWTVAAGNRRIATTHVVNAAGGWADDIAGLANLHVPVVHSRRNIFATAPDEAVGPFPMTIDLGTGAYLRSEGPRLLFGAARPGEAPGYTEALDWDWLDMVLPTMVERWPWFAELGLDRSACWAGTYEMTPDHLPIVGPDPAAPTFVHACGFSGHGVMQAPEIGRIVAEQIVDGAISSVDARPFRLERFTESGERSDLALVF
jgi:sarcosine oxidase subunit beta